MKQTASNTRNKIHWTKLLGLALVAGLSCPLCVRASENDQAGTPETHQTQPVDTPNKPVLADEDERLSYTLGFQAGSSYRREALPVDADLFARGLKDGLTDSKPLLGEDEIADTAALFQTEMQNRLRARRNLVLRMLADQNQAEGEAFLARNKEQDGVVTLPSGLQYKVLQAGHGDKPGPRDTVLCHYRGTLVNGTEFDSSYKKNKPAILPLKTVIKGWSEALQLMPVGSKWQLFVPPALAYGGRGAGNGIGPNATLVFEVELLSIKGVSGGDPQAGSQPDLANAEADIAGPQAEHQDQEWAPNPSAGGVADIKISFKLDPRITKGVYMGDRWASPPTYTRVQDGDALVVEARAESVDVQGRQVAATPTWISSDPDIISVSPSEGTAVKITVQRSGQASLKVASRGFAKELPVTATYRGESLTVAIAQNN